MKPFFLSGCITCTLIFAFLTPVYASTIFADVSGSEAYAPAAILFYESGIIQGNVIDGVRYFEPDKLVTRCEFLKMTFELYGNISSSSKSLPFKDITDDEWCYKYAQFGYNKKFIKGDGGEFAPYRSVNKVEALKILFGLFDVSLPASTLSNFEDISTTDWFLPHAIYANMYNLTAPGKNFEPSTKLRRSEVITLLYKSTYVLSESKRHEIDKKVSSDHIAKLRNKKTASPTTQITSSSSSTSSQNTITTSEPIEVTTYSQDGITLYTDMKETYEQGALINLRGRIDDIDVDEAYVILKKKDRDLQKQLLVKIKDQKFEQSIHFNEVGEFILGIVSGKSNISSVTFPIQVTQRTKHTALNTTQQKPCTEQLEKTPQGQIRVLLDGEIATYRLTTTYKEKSLSFFTQGTHNFAFPIDTLIDWPEGTYTWTVEGLGTSEVNCRSTKSLAVVTKHYSEIDNEDINVSEIPVFSEVLQRLQLNGKSTVPLRDDAAFTLPSGLVERRPLQFSSNTGSMQPFSLNYTFKGSGAYILEVNHENGIALINTPIYVGDVYPLIPDFELVDRIYPKTTGTLENIVIEYNRMLSMINTTRQKHRRSEVDRNSTLTQIAQDYAEKMIEDEFFAHVSPEGNDVGDRARNAGIMVTVSENLSQGINLQDAYNRLLRSPIHRENILEEDWESVGIGIAQDEDNIVYVVQVFAKDSFSPSDSLRVQNDIRDIVDLTKDQSLLQTMNEWSELMATEGMIDTEINGTKLLEDIRKLDKEHTLAVTVMSITEQETMERLLDNYLEQHSSEAIEAYSSGVHITSSGVVYLTMVLLIE